MRKGEKEKDKKVLFWVEMALLKYRVVAFSFKKRPHFYQVGLKD